MTPAIDLPLVLELDATEDDTWLYVGGSGAALMTGSGSASGLVSGAVHWSGRAQRTDRWETELEGAIRPEDGDVVTFSASGFLIDAPGNQHRFRGGIRFRTGDPAYDVLNAVFYVVDGVYDASSGRLRLEACP
jgi:hypothetical protein